MAVKPRGFAGLRVTGGQRGHDPGAGQGVQRPGLGGHKGMDMFQPAPGQGILGPGEAMGVVAVGFDEPRQPQIARVPDRQRDMAAFRGWHDAAPRRVVDRRGIDPGAQPHHQHRGIGHGWRLDHRAQEFRGDMAQRLTLRLQVVQDRHLAGPGGAGQHGMVDDPRQVGHLGHAMAHRTGSRDASAFDAGNPGFLQVAGQDRLKTVKFGIGEFGDGVGADLLAIGQGDAGVGSADVGKDGGHGVPSVIAGQGPGKCVIRGFGFAFQRFEIDMDQTEAFVIALGPFVIVQE